MRLMTFFLMVEQVTGFIIEKLKVMIPDLENTVSNPRARLQSLSELDFGWQCREAAWLCESSTALFVEAASALP